MRKRRTKFIYFMAAGVFVLAYAGYLRMTPNPRYAKVFDQFGKDCAKNRCSFARRLSLAKQSVYHDPEFSEGYSALGALYLERGEDVLALEHHNKALGLNHQNEKSLLQMGIHYFNKNDLARSLRYLNHFDSFNSRSYELNYYLGQAHERSGHVDLASNYYKKAHSLDIAQDGRAHDRLGALLVQSAGVKDALTQGQTVNEDTANIERASR